MASSHISAAASGLNRRYWGSSPPPAKRASGPGNGRVCTLAVLATLCCRQTPKSPNPAPSRPGLTGKTAGILCSRSLNHVPNPIGPGSGKIPGFRPRFPIWPGIGEGNRGIPIWPGSGK